MNIEKERIIQDLNKNNLEELSKTIPAYLDSYPYDVDMYVLAGYYYLLEGNLPEAERLLRLSLKHNYYDVDTYFLLGELFFAGKDFVHAMEYYARAEVLYTFYKKEYLFFSHQLYEQKVRETSDALQNFIDLHSEKTIEFKQQIDALSQAMDNSFYLCSDIIRLPNYRLGTVASFPNKEVRFLGFYQPLNILNEKYVAEKNLAILRGELLNIAYQGKDFSFQPENTALLPIASTQRESKLDITMSSGESFQTNQFYKDHFNYYRISEGIHISSENEFIVGEPVHLTQKEHLKKLVLSFFVDGLSGHLIREEGLENVMPYTHQFFSKGLICENFFTTSDWTYPSLASFVSGYSVPEHMMVHPGVNHPLPDEGKRLFGSLKQAGYYTAMFNCDYRSSSTYGYTRDIDRYAAQLPIYYNAKQVIPDAMEHINAFRETNQYLWITVADLHDIADEYDLSLNTVAQIDITDRKAYEKSATSVKQNYSPEKRKAYMQALQAIDLQFAPLYQYIESHYKEEEFVVTMFGDHGQTYLLKPESHHLGRYHSNVAFFVRGGEQHGTSREYMSATDYPHILCELAGTEPFQSPDGNLPKTFGGDGEREFTITETIHPGDPYMAAIHAPTHTFYYTSEHVLSTDARLEQGEYKAFLADDTGRPMEDPQLCQRYISMIDERLRYIYVY